MQEDKESLQLERLKIAHLSFRVSVSVFVLVSQCKFKRIIFLYFFVCHFFTHSLSVMKIIKKHVFPVMQKAGITLKQNHIQLTFNSFILLLWHLKLSHMINRALSLSQRLLVGMITSLYRWSYIYGQSKAMFYLLHLLLYLTAAAGNCQPAKLPHHKLLSKPN